MSSLVSLSKIEPVSGFLSGHNPPRRRSFYYGALLAILVWSVTPAAWLTVILRYYRKGEILQSLPSKNIHAKIWYIYSLAEIPFSIYLAFLTWKAAKKAPPPQVSFDTLQDLLTKSLTVGLPTKQSNKIATRSSVNQTSDIKNGNEDESLRGLSYLHSRQIDEEEAAQRRERLRAWFFFAEIDDVYEDNVREWLAWAFTGRDLKDAMADKKSRELLEEGVEMVKHRLNWPNITKGYNPKVKTIRLTLDPIQVMSRPLGFYVVTNGVTLATIAYLRFVHGFVLEKRGKCEFLVKKPSTKRSSKRSQPIVFLHGLGIGLGQYIPMLTKLARHQDGVVILLQPHISTGIFSKHFLSPAGKDEQAKATLDILRKYKFTNGCTTLSHSNGTMVLGWLLRTPNAAKMFTRNVLVDPVSFCMWEGSVCYSFIYRKWATGIEVLLGYFVGRELGIAHTIGRRFIWFDMILWSEEFADQSPENLHIIFAERDLLVDVPGSVKYLQESGIQDDCISILRDYQHGQALMHHGHGMKLALEHAGVRV